MFQNTYMLKFYIYDIRLNSSDLHNSETINSVQDLGLTYSYLNVKIKIAHMWRRHTSEFLSGISWWTWKTTIYQKTSISKSTIIWAMVPETWSETIFCHLGPFLPFYPLTTWKIKILKKWKKHLVMSSFYTSVTKLTII